jgi:hypothetical protein
MKIKAFRTKIALYQFQITIQGDGANTSDLIYYNIMNSIFRL